MPRTTPPPGPPAPRPPAGETIHRERRFELRRCRLALRGGGVELRGLVVHPGAVVLLPVLDDGRLVFIRNRRWQLGHRLLELPAGTLEPGEAPARCAARELIEETGYAAADLVAGRPFYAAPGLSTELMHPFLARGLTAVGQALEADEDIEVEPLTVDAARAALLDGRLADGKSLAVLGRYLIGGGV